MRTKLQHGFSYIEIVVAVVVILLASVRVMRVFKSVLAGSYQQVMTTHALSHGEQLMERILLLAWDESVVDLSTWDYQPIGSDVDPLDPLCEPGVNLHRSRIGIIPPLSGIEGDETQADIATLDDVDDYDGYSIAGDNSIVAHVVVNYVDFDGSVNMIILGKGVDPDNRTDFKLIEIIITWAGNNSVTLKTCVANECFE